MKYIKERKLFISNPKKPLINPELVNQDSNLITEIVGNDIRFGGTWFGRLINSTIRKATNAYKGTQIQSLVTKVRDQLYTMLDENMSGELKNEYGYYLYRIAMSNIDDMVKNEDIDFEEKKIQLIGKNGNGGLVQTAIEALTELNYKDIPEDYQYKIDNRDLILSKLRDFAQKLKNMKNPNTSSGTGPTPSGTGPTPSGTGPTPSGTGPTPSGTGPTPSGTGPTPSGTGPTPSGTGPTPSGTGPTGIKGLPNSSTQKMLPDPEKSRIEKEINDLKTKLEEKKNDYSNETNPDLKKQIDYDIGQIEDKIIDLTKKLK